MNEEPRVAFKHARRVRRLACLACDRRAAALVAHHDGRRFRPLCEFHLGVEFGTWEGGFDVLFADRSLLESIADEIHRAKGARPGRVKTSSNYANFFTSYFRFLQKLCNNFTTRRENRQ